MANDDLLDIGAGCDRTQSHKIEKQEARESQSNGSSTDFKALIDTIKNEGIAYRREEQREDRGKKFREWVTIALIFATVVAVGWQVKEMIKVYGPIRDQAAAEKIAANAANIQSVVATKQSQDANKALIEGQRAWVGPGAATVDAAPTVGKPVTVSIAYQNTGREPARDFVWIVTPTIVSAAADKSGKLAGRVNSYMKSCFAMLPRENAGVVFPITGFGGGTLATTVKGDWIDQAVVEGKNMLVVQGCFAYKTFEQTHHSAFCYFFENDASKAPNMNNCIGENNAD